MQEDDPQLTGTAAVELFDAAVAPELRGTVDRIIGYRELSGIPSTHREAASLQVPLVISFAEPFRIGLRDDPTAADTHSSFSSGLFAGPVVIETSGASSCLQIDFTPAGARRFFGLPMSELAGRMVGMEDLLGAAGTQLSEQLGNLPDWPSRARIAQDFIVDRIRLATPASAEIDWTFREIARQRGKSRVDHLTTRLGWTRKHLSDRFADEIGIGPKAVARIVRIRSAMLLARTGASGWADVAADCGFSDQAHLVREFRELAGETPSAWLQRVA
jgi:AraC-like DNA-binding protein